MALEIIRHDNRFRVVGQGISLDWLPDTPANRKAVGVFLRWLTDEAGAPLLTHQELSPLFQSPNRQAVCNHIQDFRACGADFLEFLSRRKKLDGGVVSAIQAELETDPFANCAQLREKVNSRLKRADLTQRNIQEAMDLIPLRPFRQILLHRVEKGEAHYREQYLLEDMMTTLSTIAGQRAEISPAQQGGMSLSDPTALRHLVDPQAPITQVHSPLRWVVFLMTLYYHGLPLSLLGCWVGVHKTTVLRWILSLSFHLWPVIGQWLTQQVKGTILYIDEKWLKIRGQWFYWFVALDHDTGLPVVGSLLATRSQWACRWVGVQLKRLGVAPKVIVTDGLLSYQCVMKTAKHLYCLFHHQQGVTRWLKQHFSDKDAIQKRKSKMKGVFQTKDKRTVKRRLAKLKAQADTLEIGEWVSQTEHRLEHLLPPVGSQRLPKTTNAIERFFRAFNRFYKVRCGFFSVVSAKRELIFFLVMYLFVRQPETGRAPIETILPQATQMPFYQFVNDPFSSVLGVEAVNRKKGMADFSPTQAVTA